MPSPDLRALADAEREEAKFARTHQRHYQSAKRHLEIAAALEWAHSELAQRNGEIQKLGDFFMEWCPEEISEGSAVDCAIHVMQKYLAVRGPALSHEGSQPHAR